MNNVINHFNTITTHKLLVMKYCFKLGLYRQGLLHDMSKYTPSEFLRGVKYYQGTQSPNNAERKVKGYSEAWLHHKGRNKHHFEYWIDYSGNPEAPLKCAPMPTNYFLEMFCDRLAASRIYNKDNYTDDMPYNYFKDSKEKKLINPEDKKRLIFLLDMLRKRGEDYTFRYIRKVYLHKKH